MVIIICISSPGTKGPSLGHTPSICYPSPEHRRQCSHLHHLLPFVQGDAIGQTAEQRRRNQDSAVDLHQILSGEIINRFQNKVKNIIL